MKASGSIRFSSVIVFLALAMAFALSACGKPAVDKQEQPAAPAAVEEPAPAPEPVKEPPKPVWPDPVPENWVVVNDYEAPADLSEPEVNPKTKKKIPKTNVPKNLLGGEWGSIGFNGGTCALAQVKDGDNTVLQITYNMPSETSECGTFEYFNPFIEKKVGKKLIKNYPQPWDLRPYDSITALVKSGDSKTHNIKIHLTEFDQYASQLQGYVSTTDTIVAGPEWQRVEFPLDKFVHEFFDRRHGKLTGFRIRFQEQDNRNDAGVVLIDNVTFIKKTGK